MDALTRRRFLLASGVVGAGALAAGATAYTLADLFDTAGDRPADAGTLVLVTLYGGNDGLNTVVPYADASYQDARPGIAYDAGEVLRLDDATGLNPGLKGFQRLFTDGRLAIVRGVGYPKPDRSHFRSMDIWQTADPVRPGTTGWLGRWLDTAGGDPRLAVSFEPALPPLLAGANSAGAAVPTGARRQVKGVTGLGLPAAGEPPLQARAARCFADLERVEAMITQVRDAQPEDPDDDDSATGTGGRTDLAAQLDLVAQCVEAGVATRAFSVSLGGFDTHADEKQLQEILLAKVDKAVTGFVDRMAGRPVTVVVYSEFGRRVRANAGDGTDHGTASNVFVLGTGVRGGLHGEQPSLTDLDDGDLKHTVDFRDVYAGLLTDVLAADPAEVLGGWTGRLSLTGS
ncbi:hypothetical protein Ais01nite_47510 [Asanoa ishikariensis]|uniref:Uncharacterized conserved protein, DUF1501 family n=1 Tax=Asanoa ishikariensis TaxID=137265 RepID=A0A1H3RZQ4_9ACTN|nr:DUF1501 domain-containing protein [Asanoa ishikariensis]GIF66716.1 hypothetical protein Ais01nite_47510 [Asanoa ishikariensis]SDZ30379.1 Uncharacterized conserved protein, DUF1501 family [Asanoa ishikariensis]